MDAVAQANGIDKTQLSNGHRKQQRKRSWNIDPTWKLLHEKEERAQLNENGLHDDKFGYVISGTLSSDKNPNVFFKCTNSSKLEQPVLQWSSCTVQDNVDSI